MVSAPQVIAGVVAVCSSGVPSFSFTKLQILHLPISLAALTHTPTTHFHIQFCTAYIGVLIFGRPETESDSPGKGGSRTKAKARVGIKLIQVRDKA